MRCIHKACVKDRVTHQAVFRILYPLFDGHFIFDSYACRVDKGVHAAVNRLKVFARKASSNFRKNIFVLQCDIKKYFNTIDKSTLKDLIKKRIGNKDTLWLVEEIIKSFNRSSPQGIPLGNVTSQLFSNIYLNELDQFVKHALKERYYIRYCDDFLVVSDDDKHLKKIIGTIDRFLKERLQLSLHPHKIQIQKYEQGIDFLGYVQFPHHNMLRTKTKKRIMRKIKIKKEELNQGVVSIQSFNSFLQSYYGILQHCNGHKIRKEIDAIANE